MELGGEVLAKGGGNKQVKDVLLYSPPLGGCSEKLEAIKGTRSESSDYNGIHSKERNDQLLDFTQSEKRGKSLAILRSTGEGRKAWDRTGRCCLLGGKRGSQSLVCGLQGGSRGGG